MGAPVAAKKPTTAVPAAASAAPSAADAAKFGRRAPTPSGGPPATANAAQLAKLKALQAEKAAAPYVPSTGTGARPGTVGRPSLRAAAPAAPASRPASRGPSPSRAGPRPPTTSAAKPPSTAAGRSTAVTALAAKASAKPTTAAPKPPAPPAKPAAKPTTAAPKPPATASGRAPSSLGKRPTTSGGSPIDMIPAAKAKSFSAIPPELAEYEEAGGPGEPLCKCKSCGRTFNKEAFAKHAKVCKSVNTKRKPMDVQAQRVKGTDLAKYAAKATKVVTKKPSTAAKKAKWKQESNQLRVAMAAAKAMAAAQAAGKDMRLVEIPMLAEEDDSRVACPKCGRKFNEDVCARHIPTCKETKGGKASALKGGAKPGTAAPKKK